MTSRHLLPTLLFLLLVLAGVPPVNAQGSIKIAAVEAHLFYGDTGTFSNDVFTDPDIVLWNVIGSSDATMVFVILSGPPETYVDHARVSLLATTTRGVMLRRTLHGASFTKEGRYTFAFWLYNTGCEPVTITVTLTGATQLSSVAKTLEFRCGE